MIFDANFCIQKENDMRIVLKLSGKGSLKVNIDLSDKQIKEITKYIGYNTANEIGQMFADAAQSLYDELRAKNSYPCISYMQVKESFESGTSEKLKAVIDIFKEVGIQEGSAVIDIITMVFGMEATIDESEFIDMAFKDGNGAANENQISWSV